MKSAVVAARSIGPDEIAAAGLCIGCGSCVALSRNPHAGMLWDGQGQLRPNHGLSGAIFDRVCPFAPQSSDENELATRLFPHAGYRNHALGRFETAYVGHVEEGDFRATGSSGGMVTWTAVELLRRGLVDGIVHVLPVAHPRREGRFFRYGISRSEAEVRAGACSRYYPVNLTEVLRTIQATPGRYAITGIPCFIKAINLLRAEDAVFGRRIAYTLGLFCGHMKSEQFVSSLAWQIGVDPVAVTAVEYRVKTANRPANWYRARLRLEDGSSHEVDWWHLADGDWGAGFFQNSACNYCDDVVAETADIAFGDAWIEPYSSDGHGTNVVIVRKPELDGILRAAARLGRITMRRVDASFVEETQAAGLRQRREGLAYRLKWKPPALALAKRVGKGDSDLSLRRKLVYRARFLISRWSPRMFNLAQSLGCPVLYVWWAKTALLLYQGLTYSRGTIGRVFDALERIHVLR